MLMFIVMAVLLLLLASALLFIPLRQSKLLASSLSVLVCFATITAYWHWGGAKQWLRVEKNKAHQLEVASVMKQFNTPEQVIERLTEHLQVAPDSPKGWFLLGRLYASQNRWDEAVEAFKQAHNLNKESLETALNYSQSLIMTDSPGQAMGVIDLILRKSPQQVDALSLKAMAAFKQQDYTLAIATWRRLMPLVPPDSKQSELITQAIASAKARHLSP